MFFIFIPMGVLTWKWRGWWTMRGTGNFMDDDVYVLLGQRAEKLVVDVLLDERKDVRKQIFLKRWV